VLEAARGGDEAAFGQIVDRHRGMLEAHCRRMLGSSHDVEDAVQETLIKAWRALPRFRGQSSLRTWLHRIATNVCLDALRQRPKREVRLDDAPRQGLTSDTESLDGREACADQGNDLAVAPSSPAARYEQREAVEMAFTVALQRLSPKQRAVLILRDVLGFSAREVAELMETSVASVTSALQRARRGLERRSPAETGPTTISTVDEVRTRRLAEDFAGAVEAGDLARILGLLAEDLLFAGPKPSVADRAPTRDLRQAGRRLLPRAEVKGLPHCDELHVVRTRQIGHSARLHASRLAPLTSSCGRSETHRDRIP